MKKKIEFKFESSWLTIPVIFIFAWGLMDLGIRIVKLVMFGHQ